MFVSWLGLLTLAALSFVLSFAHLGNAGIPVALAIAFVKALVVALVFMELAVEVFTVRIILIVVAFFFTLLIGLVWADIGTRTVPPLIPQGSAAN